MGSQEGRSPFVFQLYLIIGVKPAGPMAAKLSLGSYLVASIIPFRSCSAQDWNPAVRGSSGQERIDTDRAITFFADRGCTRSALPAWNRGVSNHFDPQEVPTVFDPIPGEASDRVRGGRTASPSVPSGHGPLATQRREARLASHEAIRHIDGLAARSTFQKVLDPAAAGDREQPRLPVARLATCQYSAASPAWAPAPRTATTLALL